MTGLDAVRLVAGRLIPHPGKFCYMFSQDLVNELQPALASAIDQLEKSEKAIVNLTKQGFDAELENTKLRLQLEEARWSK